MKKILPAAVAAAIHYPHFARPISSGDDVERVLVQPYYLANQATLDQMRSNTSSLSNSSYFSSPFSWTGPPSEITSSVLDGSHCVSPLVGRCGR